MNGFDGEFQGGQVVFPPELQGQTVGQRRRQGQRLGDPPRHAVVGHSRRQGIDGHDPPGHVLPSRGLKDGVDHGAAAIAFLHRPIKDIFLPRLQAFFHIALVEEGQGQAAAVVHRPGFYQIQPPSDAGQAGMLCDHPLNTHLFLRRGPANGVDLPPVLVAAGVVGQQVAHGVQVQFFQLLCPGGTHPGQGGEGGVEGESHGVCLLSGICAPILT